MRRLFIMRKDLNMSPGKLSAQVSHCAEAYWTNLIRKNSYVVKKRAMKDFWDPDREDDNDIYGYEFDYIFDKDIFEQYIDGSFTKTVCEAKNKNHLLKAKEKAESLNLIEGVDFGLIYDKCLTELEPEEENGTTLTGIWFAPLSDEVSHMISKKYQLYK